MSVEASPNETTRARSRGVKGFRAPGMALSGIAGDVIQSGKTIEQVVKTTVRTVNPEAAQVESSPDYSTYKWWVWRDDASHSWLGEYMGKPNEPTLREHYEAGAYVMCPVDEYNNPIKTQEIKIKIGGPIGRGVPVQPSPNGSVTQPSPNVVMVQPATQQAAPSNSSGDAILQMMMAQQAGQEERRAREDSQREERARQEAAERKAELESIRQEQARREEIRRIEEQRREDERRRAEERTEQLRLAESTRAKEIEERKDQLAREEATRTQQAQEAKEERLRAEMIRQREIEERRQEQLRLEILEQRKETERREETRRAEQERIAEERRRDEARREEDRRRDEQRRFELAQAAEVRRLEEDARRRSEDAQRREAQQQFLLGLVAAAVPLVQKALEPKPDTMTTMFAKMAEDQARRDATLREDQIRREAKESEDRMRLESERLRKEDEARRRADELREAEIESRERMDAAAAEREERQTRMMMQMNRQPVVPPAPLQPQQPRVDDVLNLLQKGIELGERVSGKNNKDDKSADAGFPFAAAFEALPAVMQALKPDAGAMAQAQAQAHAAQVEAAQRAAMPQNTGYSPEDMSVNAQHAVDSVVYDEAALEAKAAQDPAKFGRTLHKFLRNNPDFARSVVPHEMFAANPAAPPEDDPDPDPEDDPDPDDDEGVENESDEVEEDDPESEQALAELSAATGLSRDQILAMSEEELEAAVDLAAKDEDAQPEPEMQQTAPVEDPVPAPTLQPVAPPVSETSQVSTETETKVQKPGKRK